MPPVKQSPEEIKQLFVSLAFDEAYSISEVLYGNPEDGTPGAYARRKANREQLRQLRDQGMLTDEQRDELEELYPERDANRKSDEERAAELEAKARAVRERAAEKAAKNATADPEPETANA